MRFCDECIQEALTCRCASIQHKTRWEKGPAAPDEDRYWLPILIYPPCVPLDLEITETYRQEIGATFKRLKASREAPPTVAPPAKTA